MTSASHVVATPSTSALELNLRALRPILADPEVTEVCINRPGEAFVETRTGWERRPLPFADFDWCTRLAKLIANSTRQRIDEATPLLSASLPTGERAQIVLPPATTPGTVAITLRRPSQEVWSITELASRGIFRATRRSGVALDDTEQQLLKLLASQEYEAFILLAEVRAEEAFDYLRNVNSGHPGSITSIHAGSCELAFEQLVLLVKQSAAGRELARSDIKRLLYLLVDVVIQFGVARQERFIREIFYEPQRRCRGLAEIQ